MNREEKLPCPVCGKARSRMASHFASSHPELNPDDFGIIGPEVRERAAREPAGADAPANPAPADTEAPAGEPAEASGLTLVIDRLLEHLDQQAETIQAQQARIEALSQDLQGFQTTVVQNLNQMPTLINRAVTAHFDQVLAEAQAAAGDNPRQDPALPGATPGPAEKQRGGRAILEQLLPLLLQSVLQPQQPQPGGDLDRMVKMFEGIDRLAELRQAPYRHGQEDTLRLLTTADKMGIPLGRVAEAWDQQNRARTQPGPAPAGEAA